MAVLAATHANITRCAERLRAGGIIAMPTETVYGLAADATNAAAVASVYASKTGQKSIRSSVMSARRKRRLNWEFSTPMRAVWPSVSGLAAHACCAAVCRLPRQRTGKRRSADIGPALPRPQCRARIAWRNRPPLVAPSANPSGQLSPSQAHHVSAHLPDIDVLDGGACTVGLESTIIGCLEENPTLLRVGGLSRDALEACLDRAWRNCRKMPTARRGWHRAACCAITRRARRFASMGQLPKATIFCWVSGRRHRTMRQKI